MRLPRAESLRRTGSPGQKAFTLTEVAMTMAISLLISAGIVASQLYGMRMTEIAQAKVSTRDKAGQILRLLTADVHAAKALKIGQGSFDSFTEVDAHAPQLGNAMQIHPSPDTNSFIRYYWDETDTQLKRVTNGASTAVVVANAVSHGEVFTAEDHAGNVLSNSQNAFVVGVNLQFYKLENPDLPIGPSNYYRSYQLRTKIAPRAF